MLVEVPSIGTLQVPLVEEGWRLYRETRGIGFPRGAVRVRILDSQNRERDHRVSYVPKCIPLPPQRAFTTPLYRAHFLITNYYNNTP